MSAGAYCAQQCMEPSCPLISLRISALFQTVPTSPVPSSSIHASNHGLSIAIDHTPPEVPSVAASRHRRTRYSNENSLLVAFTRLSGGGYHARVTTAIPISERVTVWIRYVPLIAGVVRLTDTVAPTSASLSRVS